MRRDSEDDDLRGRFEALREQDRLELPPFRGLLARRAGEGREVNVRLRLAAAAIAAVLLVALGGAWLAARRGPGSSPSGVGATLVAWRSPTDSLLRTPGAELVLGLPRVGDAGYADLGSLATRPKNEAAGTLRP